MTAEANSSTTKETLEKVLNVIEHSLPDEEIQRITKSSSKVLSFAQNNTGLDISVKRRDRISDNDIKEFEGMS